jgi:predicted nucleic-acid-binding protein
MKLSELVAYRNQLNRLHFDEARNKTDLDLSSIKHLVNSKDFDPNNIRQQMQTKHDAIHQCFDEFTKLIDQAKEEAQAEINIKEQYWLTETHRLYSQEMVNDTVEHILNRRAKLTDEHDNIIRTRIKNFSNSLHPAMIIRPGLETFIQHMVSFDPLYLIDQSDDMLFPCTLEFPEQYRRRLRPVIVNERDLDIPILQRLPDNQFAMCLAYNFFEFKPMAVIERWLEEVFAKLKPGGRIMMTFNDCDNEKAVRLAENYYACYTPGRLVKAAAQRIGYEIYFIWNDNVPTTWLELEKPGALTTLRGGQALAKVVHLPPKT